MSNSSDDKDFLKEARLDNTTRREKKRRLVAPPNVKVSRAPQLLALIDDAFSIIGAELQRYKSKTTKGMSLDAKEARIVQGYVDSLTKMHREARESQKPEQLQHLSDEELLALAKEAIEDEEYEE